MSKNFHLIVSATREFAQLQRPTFSQKLQFQDLLLAYLDKLPEEDILSVCSLLSNCKHVPRTLVVHLCKQKAELCRPLLVASPVLQEADLIELSDGPEKLSHARIIARKSNLQPAVAAHLRGIVDTKIDRALDLRQKPLFLASEASADAAQIVESEVENTFLSLCNEESDVLIYTAFSDHLGLNLISSKILCNDLTSRNLPTAMRYLGLSEPTAWQVYSRLARSAAHKSGVAEAFSATYRSLTAEDCRSIVNEWRMEELVMAVRYSSAANQSEPDAEALKNTA